MKNTKVKNKISGVTNLLKKTDYDTKLCNISNRVTSNEPKQLRRKIKLGEHVSSYTKPINGLSRKLSQVLTKDNKSVF